MLCRRPRAPPYAVPDACSPCTASPFTADQFLITDDFTEETHVGRYIASTTSDAWRRERKAAGGRRSRMPARWGQAELDRLDGDLAGLTVAEQAEALGTSRSSIDRMRKALRARAADPS